MISFIEYVKINIKKLSIRQIVMYALMETILLLLFGIILSVININIKIYIPDYIFIIVTVEIFEMISAIKKTITVKKELFLEILFWLKFTIFSVISYIYILIILQMPLFDTQLFLFNNLKFTTLITMVLMAGLDSLLDLIYDNEED
ncbi:hypothetical protein [Proteocatella sphenisci]|uniref:hypothetical protein n=1 Tax=Proteocatella sphenisci TaxID=181070 RepID=UPI00048D921A|nr:hypothetical protein [Proteocatella sphenisci]